MSEKPETQSADPAAPAPTKAVRKPVLLAVAGATLAVGVAAGLFVVGPMINGPKAAAKPEEDSAKAGEHGEPGAGGTSPVYTFDNMVLNPAGSNGSRFLLIATAIEVSDPSLVETMRSRDAEARDLLGGVLAAKTVEQLSNLSLRDSLRAEIANALNKMVNKPSAVRRVHFPQFVVQ
jgi:flagellar FliL protein